jgi:hypothetical protein
MGGMVPSGNKNFLSKYYLREQIMNEKLCLSKPWAFAMACGNSQRSRNPGRA